MSRAWGSNSNRIESGPPGPGQWHPETVFRIPLTSDSLARSRFALSPGPEITETLHLRGRSHSYPHVRARLAAAGRCPHPERALLEALIDPAHPYIPDFLSPVCEHPVSGIEEVADAIANTPESIVDYHVDICFRDRPVHPHEQVTIGTPSEYDAWRRPMPHAVAALLERGPRHVAEQAAAAVCVWFDTVLADEWPATLGVLQADMAYRAKQLATRGPRVWSRISARGVLGRRCRLRRVHLRGRCRLGPRRHDPHAVHRAHRPPGRRRRGARSAAVDLSARGVGALWSTSCANHTSATADLLGTTRGRPVARVRLSP